MTQQAYPIRCRIRNEDGDGPTRVDVFDDIGGGGWFDDGLTAKSFAAQMAGIKGALEVHINSGGGDVFDGIAIGNAIRGHAGPVTTVVDGLAASIASVIAQAGQERVVQPGSMLMIHDAFGMAIGNAAEMAKMAETLDTVSGNIAGIYASRAGGTAEDWRTAMKAESWYTADEAVAAGLADRVGDGTAELPPGLDVAAFTAVPGRIAAALRKLPQATAPEAGEDPQASPPPVIADADGTQGSAPRLPKGKKKGKKAARKKAAKKKARLRGKAQGPCCSVCGPDCACGGQPAAHGRVTLDAIRAIVREEIRAAAVDESEWDASKAWSAGAASDDPAGFYKAICAGEKSGGGKDTQGHWALPHHYAPGRPPNRNGVNAAKSRIGQTQGLKDKSAAQAHLDAHSDAMGSAGDDDAGNHAHPDLSGHLEQIRAALKGAHE